jgi:hypothetical protein
VRAFTAAWDRPLRILVNNAGIMALPNWSAPARAGRRSSPPTAGGLRLPGRRDPGALEEPPILEKQVLAIISAEYPSLAQSFEPGLCRIQVMHPYATAVIRSDLARTESLW